MDKDKVIKEFCAENFEKIPQAIAAGAGRIELCDNLAEGGTTPSYGVIKQTLSYAKEKNVPTMVMIRPRGGDFVYDEAEAAIMKDDVKICKDLQADGIVFGCLKDNWLDEKLIQSLLAQAQNMAVTFHMAFDELSKENQFRAIDWLAENGVDRILTHGGSGEKPISETTSHLLELITYANERIIILPGAGIRFDNVDHLLATLNLSEAHGTQIVSI
ncbi:copper homeostasis protein CutC [Candidatus Enterococcus murrayae]|uniref:PF03932 family protein CutC n=1 Tax=Candidatus Enterococcus murrayae TaxID=2815321 RepID=A0ABS3HHJ3_9ENTE|nr:copper homeostasis protein CutC [Enterococcus sp. MJM16]